MQKHPCNDRLLSMLVHECRAVRVKRGVTNAPFKLIDETEKDEDNFDRNIGYSRRIEHRIGAAVCGNMSFRDSS